MAANSAAELEPVANVTSRLKALLARAKTVKPETTVEPPLPTAPFTEEIENLHDDFADIYDQTYRFTAVEMACRDIFYSMVHLTPITDQRFAEVWNLLDIVLFCGDQGRCTPELVCWLLEELLDSQTTEGCRTVFDYLDSRRDRLAQKDFHKKNLVFLRSCNELLRRLSRAEDAIFCGRVFFFLFQTFPLGDKSSVNLRGEFHTENTTKFDVPDQESNSKDLMDVDSKPEKASASETKESTPQLTATGKPGSKAVPIKVPPKKASEEEVLSTSELYPIFWRLQHDFSDPTRLFNNDVFSDFKKGLTSTISKFKKTATVVQTKASEEDKRGTKRKLDANSLDERGSDHIVDNYNPKYLTSRDLFDLELSDLAFQRHILVQALILIDFLLSLSERAKKRSAAAGTNKSMLYAFTLSEEDAKWATTTRSSITQYLSSSNEGRQYCRMVETVLARDKNWVRWKVESCPSIVRGPVSTEEELKARNGAATFTRPRRIPDKFQNAMSLGFLDEGTGGTLEALKDPSRYTAPSIESMVEQIRTEKLDAEFATTDEENARYDTAIQNAKWRILRQARATNLSLLDKVDSTKDLEQILSPDVPSGSTLEQNGDDAMDVTASNPAEEIAEVAAIEAENLPMAADDKTGMETA